MSLGQASWWYLLVKKELFKHKIPQRNRSSYQELVHMFSEARKSHDYTISRLETRDSLVPVWAGKANGLNAKLGASSLKTQEKPTFPPESEVLERPVSCSSRQALRAPCYPWEIQLPWSLQALHRLQGAPASGRVIGLPGLHIQTHRIQKHNTDASRMFDQFSRQLRALSSQQLLIRSLSCVELVPVQISSSHNLISRKRHNKILIPLCMMWLSCINWKYTSSFSQKVKVLEQYWLFLSSRNLNTTVLWFRISVNRNMLSVRWFWSHQGPSRCPPN